MLGRAPYPARAARLTRAQMVAALRRANRRATSRPRPSDAGRAAGPGAAAAGRGQAAYAAVVVGQVRLITALNAQIAALEEVVAEHFGRHPAADIYLSQPGLGVGPRRPGAGRVRRRPEPVPRRQSPQELLRHIPITRASGTQDRRAGPLRPQPSPRRRAPPVGVLRAHAAHPVPAPTTTRCAPAKIGHHAALRQLGNRLVGILHGCLKTGTHYDEHTAWATTHRPQLDTQEPWDV